MQNQLGRLRNVREGTKNSPATRKPAIRELMSRCPPLAAAAAQATRPGRTRVERGDKGTSSWRLRSRRGGDVARAPAHPHDSGFHFEAAEEGARRVVRDSRRISGTTVRIVADADRKLPLFGAHSLLSLDLRGASELNRSAGAPPQFLCEAPEDHSGRSTTWNVLTDPFDCGERTATIRAASRNRASGRYLCLMATPIPTAMWPVPHMRSRR